MARFPRDSRSSAMLVAALAGAVVCAVSGVTVAKEASRSRAAAVEYPEVATAASPRVLGEFNGVKVYGGGFGSALALDPRAPGYFYLLTDRGPNADSIDPDKKVFPVPAFVPQIGRFKLEGEKLVLVSVIELKNAKGRKITGLPNPKQGNTGEVAVDLRGRELGTDPDGLDSEGLVALRDGTFWISDEYGPWLVHFDPKGRTLERVGPFPARSRSRRCWRCAVPTGAWSRSPLLRTARRSSG